MKEMIRILKDKMGKVLLINGIRCVVQSYKENDFVNLSPIRSGRESIAGTMGNIRIDFVKRTISTDGKETPEWKSFVSLLDIDQINNTLQMSKIRILNSLLAQADQAYKNSVTKILDEIVPGLDWEFREDIAQKICWTKHDSISPVEIILMHDGAAYCNPDLSELLAERIQQTKNENRDIKPGIDERYWCETCGSHSHETHPITGYCFHCGTDNWEPENYRHIL